MNKPSKVEFIDETTIRQTLTSMVSDDKLKTEPTYSHDSAHLVTFFEKHLTYLKNHPKVNPEHYLANLHTMIKIRSPK